MVTIVSLVSRYDDGKRERDFVFAKGARRKTVSKLSSTKIRFRQFRRKLGCRGQNLNLNAPGAKFRPKQVFDKKHTQTKIFVPGAIKSHRKNT
jgi:hypothetical protein